MRKLVSVLALAVCSSAWGAETVELPKPLQKTFEEHCLDCHDSGTRKGGLDLEKLGTQFQDPALFAEWVKIHDRVRAGEMPPKKEKRLPQADLDLFTGWLNSELSAVDAEREKKDVRAGVRRLSRVEFENTLRDLLGLPGLRVLGSLPSDGKAHGLDRSAEALDFSFVHLDAYLSAVDAALQAATPTLIEQPPVSSYHYTPQESNEVLRLVNSKEAIPLIGMTRDETFVPLGLTAVDDEPKSTAIAVFRHGDADFRYNTGRFSPKFDGYYRIRVKGYSVAWDGQQITPTQRHGALSFGLFSKGYNYGLVDLPPNRAGIGELTTWMEQINEPVMFTAETCERIRDYAYGSNRHVTGPLVPVPGVAIEGIDIDGPFYPSWPLPSQISLFGDLPVGKWTKETGQPKPVMKAPPAGRPWVQVLSAEPEKDGRRLLTSFLRRAFRRPATDAEVERYQHIFLDRLKDGDHFQDALKAAHRSALMSPDFLLLHGSGPFALASKLSYFLWAGPPDEELLGLAENGQLCQPVVLRAQAQRMLQDKRAARFVEDFTGQWLRLREIDATQPDKVLYPQFSPLLQESMIEETHAYFTELLNSDLGISHVVKSDFAMLNEPLAACYGIPGVRGHEIRRVALPPGSVRGPFIAQGSVLKVSANGTTTSPVTRGAFVMDKILGIVPTPPPPNAGTIEPDTRGATTVREQLEKHKKNAICASCHLKMDPYGFALESFDVMGAKRDFYRALDAPPPPIGPPVPRVRAIVQGRSVEYHPGKPVDCTGQLPDGRPFKDLAELQDMLAANEEGLARAFVGQLVTYSTGATVSFADRAEVERILARAKPTGYGVRTLLVETILSPLFSKQ
jgi:hypothetical protein